MAVTYPENLRIPRWATHRVDKQVDGSWRVMGYYDDEARAARLAAVLGGMVRVATVLGDVEVVQ